MKSQPLILGAVAYDPKVVSIWEGFKEYLQANGLDFDFILFSNYEKQVEAHFRKLVDITWNSPLAWLQSVAIAEQLGKTVEPIIMRNSDCDLESLIIVRTDSTINDLTQLQNKKIAVGAKDSPQATLIPLEHLAKHGLTAAKNLQVVYHDLLVGKHGDHIGGEREAARALMNREVDAACLIDSNHLLFVKEGILSNSNTRVLTKTGHYDHCNFTIIKEDQHPMTQKFSELLLAMKYEDPAVRHLLDLEGLKQWLPGRSSGYKILADAVERFGTIQTFVHDCLEKL